MKAIKQTAAVAARAAALCVAGPAAQAGEKELLDVLLQNSVITQQQYDQLVATYVVEKEQQAARTVQASWPERISLSGDMRVRHERIDVDNQGRRSDRQRIRARLGVNAMVNDEVDVGLRIVTAGGITSTNEDLDDNFVGKDLFLDRAFIDWHPDSLENVHFTAGKFAQPWVSLSGLVWDSDVNPEGLAFNHTMDLGGAEVLTHAGYFVATNNADGNGNQFRHDLNLFSAQVAVNTALSDAAQATFGVSAYVFDDEVPGNPATAANSTTEFGLYELFASLDLNGLPIPLTLYGQWVTNFDADGPQDDEDRAWLVGAETTVGKWSIDYNYRDVERNAVVDLFDDSDFARGFVDSWGHSASVSYALSKNFSLGATYIKAKSDQVNPGTNNAHADTLQVDFVAKYK